MKIAHWLPVAVVAIASVAFAATFEVSAESAVSVPAPKTEAVASNAASEKVILAGGCFWGVQGVYQHVKGVTSAISGYSGGTKVDPTYEQVSRGWTGHAESVEVTFDPRVISFGKILQIYFSVAHNPTELNRQGPDEGTQYRSEIFAANSSQKKLAADYIAELNAAKVFGAQIVTKIEPMGAFYPAEGYHQNYATLHPDQPYIAYNDLPKIENLNRLFPSLYRAKPELVADAH
jgi:peptide-methionine (S)-S-oxide reductase